MQHEQRLAALAVLRVMAGTPLPAALAAVADGADTRGHAFVQELAYGTLRHWGRLDALTQVLATKPLSDRALATLIAVALYQLDHTHAPRPQAKPLVNAMLRRYLREREALNARVSKASRVALWSYPRWWIGRVEADYPQHWEAILSAGNERPPLTLRVNARVTTREALAAQFADAGIETRNVGAVGLIVVVPQPVTGLPGFAEGAFAVQDAGAQLAAPLLAPAAGMRVLDACAAPGGKAAHLAGLAAIDLTALDSDAARLARVDDNFARLRVAGPTVRTQVGDAGDPASWWDGRPFDRILVDVPCTASGIVRRHPDAKWLRRKRDLDSFVTQQRRMLPALWQTLAPGGLLLYATCSVFAAENEHQINDFVKEHPEALRETITFPGDCLHVGGQLLPAMNGTGHNQDGFFYALLRRA
jgi:16S rRNA (cytosine967-C5)-methyltransferase